METAQTITDVRKVEMYESKLVPNCGQFYTLFHFDTTEKIIRVRRKLLTRDKSQIPSLYPAMRVEKKRR